MADVFISYHEKSAGELAEQIAYKLDAAGISSWCARRNLPPSGNFALNIPAQIHKCRLFLLILTESAYQSKHVLNEVGIAFSRYNKGENITILPIEIGDFTRKDWVEYYLIHTQSVKIHQPNTQRVEMLIRQIARLLSAPLRTAQPTPKPTIINSGRTGDCAWELNAKHVLTISGKGRMQNYDDEKFPPWYYKGVNSVVIKQGVTSIGNRAFRGCNNPTSIQIPNSVTSIGSSAFCYCGNLRSVQIPNSVTSIGNGAFCGCNLTSVQIPDSVTSIGNGAFSGCKNLTGISVSPANQFYRDIDGVLFDKSCRVLLCYPIAKNGTIYSIPNSVTSIGGYAFSYCKSLTSVHIPNNLTSIGEYAFFFCTHLASINIPDNVSSIGYYAFARCDSLTEVSIPTRTRLDIHPNAGQVSFSRRIKVMRRP